MTAQKLCLALVLMFAAGILPTLAQAGYPPYLVLQTPPSGPRRISHGSNAGMAERVSTPAYSYGHFGVQPRNHPSRHVGFYRNYTEWSWK